MVNSYALPRFKIRSPQHNTERRAFSKRHNTVSRAFRRFGAALAISDGFLVVGEPAVDPYTPTAATGGMVPPAPYEGVVRLFYVNGSSAIIVRPPDDVAEPSFGAAVAMADHVGVMGVS